MSQTNDCQFAPSNLRFIRRIDGTCDGDHVPLVCANQRARQGVRKVDRRRLHLDQRRQGALCLLAACSMTTGSCGHDKGRSDLEVL